MFYAIMWLFMVARSFSVLDVPELLKTLQSEVVNNTRQLFKLRYLLELFWSRSRFIQNYFTAFAKYIDDLDTSGIGTYLIQTCIAAI